MKVGRWGMVQEAATTKASRGIARRSDETRVPTPMTMSGAESGRSSSWVSDGHVSGKGDETGPPDRSRRKELLA